MCYSEMSVCDCICLVYTEDMTTKLAIYIFIALISDIIFGEVWGGSSLWTSCHNIGNIMGFHFGLDASEFHYATFPHVFS